jgi:hypothetical protein
MPIKQRNVNRGTEIAAGEECVKGALFCVDEMTHLSSV